MPPLEKRSGEYEGFTIFEVVCVLCVVAILTAAALPRLLETREGAEGTRIKMLGKAMEGAAGVVQALCALKDKCPDDFALMEGIRVETRFGEPSASARFGEGGGILTATRTSPASGLIVESEVFGEERRLVIRSSRETGGNCRVIYEEATKSKPTSTTILTSGCK